MNETLINFINRSNDTAPKDVVFYQLNESSMNHGEMPIAWKVIKNCGVNETFSFEFDSVVEIAIPDFMGSYKNPIQPALGKVVEISNGNFGSELKQTDRTIQIPYEFAVYNALRHEPLSTRCFRNNRLLAVKEDIFPNESAFFHFSGEICIGVAAEIEEGVGIGYELMNRVQAKFDLSLIGSADLIMTGGGEGENAEPLEFNLENVQQKSFKPENNFGFPH